MTAKGIPVRPAAKRLNKLPVIILLTIVFVIIAACFYVVAERQKKQQAAAATNNIDNIQPINNNTPKPEFLNEEYAKRVEAKARQEKLIQGTATPPAMSQESPAQLPGPDLEAGTGVPSQTGKAVIKDQFASGQGGFQPMPGQSSQPFYQEPPNQQQKSEAEMFKEKVANDKREMALKAQKAPTIVPVTTTGQTQQPTAQMPGMLPQGMPQYQQTSPMMANRLQEESDQAMKRDFLDTVVEDAVVLKNAYHEAVSPFELKQGHLIPMTLITTINSDLPGRIKAQVTENVYDTATGNYLLIPQGTMVNGVYDSRVVYGQRRVLIAWQRLIFPDGSSLNVESMPGTDQEGAAGLHDLVDNHYFQVFGAAILMSIVNAGATMAMDDGNNTGRNVETAQDVMAKSAAMQMQQTFSKIIDKIMNIQPELIIRQGKEGHIILTKDILGLKPYNPAKKPTYYLKTAGAQI